MHTGNVLLFTSEHMWNVSMLVLEWGKLEEIVIFKCLILIVVMVDKAYHSH